MKDALSLPYITVWISFYIYKDRELSFLRFQLPNTAFYRVLFAVPSESNNTNLQPFQTAFIFPKKILSHSVLTDFIKVSLMSYFSWMNVMVERTSMDGSVASLNPFWLPYEMSINFKTLVCNHWSSMSESLNLAFISAILLKTRPTQILLITRMRYLQKSSTSVVFHQ